MNPASPDAPVSPVRSKIFFSYGCEREKPRPNSVDVRERWCTRAGHPISDTFTPHTSDHICFGCSILCMERTTFILLAERAAEYPLVWRRSQISRLPYLQSSQCPRKQDRPRPLTF